MGKALLIAFCVLLGGAQLRASATAAATATTLEDADTSPVTGRPHDEQLAFFKTQLHNTSIGSRFDAYSLLFGRVSPQEDKKNLSSWTQGPYCCAEAAHEADLLKIQQLSGEVRESLDRLVEKHVPLTQECLHVLEVDDMLHPLVVKLFGLEKVETSFARWQRGYRNFDEYIRWASMDAWEARSHSDSNVEGLSVDVRNALLRDVALYRAMYAYFSNVFVNALVAHSKLEELSFTSKGLHPFLLPVLEAFVKQGSGPRSLSFATNALRCENAEERRRFDALKPMTFLVSIGDEITYTTFNSKSYVNHRRFEVSS